MSRASSSSSSNATPARAEPAHVAPDKATGPKLTLAVPIADGGAESARRRGTTPQGPFEIAGRRVRRGERLQFELPMAQLYTRAPLDMTVEVIHGRWQGPVLLVCAGIHGDELNGIEIIRRLRTLTSLDRLRGTLVLVPVVNLFGFLNQSRYLPDRRDLNRSFPGTERGSVAARTANLFFQSVVARCTHVIDLHTARLSTARTCPRSGRPSTSRASRRWRAASPFPSSSTPGSSPAAYAPRQAGSASRSSPTRPARRCASTRRRSSPASGAWSTSCARSTCCRPDAAARRRAAPYVANTTSWFRSPADGLFRPLARLGTQIQKGATLGVVSGPFSSDDTVLAAPFEGIVICVSRLPLVNEGDAPVPSRALPPGVGGRGRDRLPRKRHRRGPPFRYRVRRRYRAGPPMTPPPQCARPSLNAHIRQDIPTCWIPSTTSARGCSPPS